MEHAKAPINQHTMKHAVNESKCLSKPQSLDGLHGVSWLMGMVSEVGWAQHISNRCQDNWRARQRYGVWDLATYRESRTSCSNDLSGPKGRYGARH